MKARVAIVVVVVMVLCGVAQGATLYDINFQGPDYAVGSAIPAAPWGDDGPAPRDRVSRVNFGEQVVRDSLGPLTDQPAEFIARTTPGGSFRYSQIEMKIDDLTSFPAYRLKFDAWMGSAASSSELITLWDVPGSVSIAFRRDGSIVRNPGVTSQSQIGTFDPAAILSVDWAVDISTNTCQVIVNDVLQYSGIFRTPYPAAPDPPSYVRSVRLNFSGETDGESIAVDNIQVYAAPEPGTILLLASGAVAVRRVKSEKLRKAKGIRRRQGYGGQARQ
jgi:hypothetical protein